MLLVVLPQVASNEPDIVFFRINDQIDTHDRYLVRQNRFVKGTALVCRRRIKDVATR